MKASTMTLTKKNGKAMRRPLPSSLAPDDASSTDLAVSKKVSADKVTKSKMPFRYRWQKKHANGHPAYQDALMNLENADSREAKGKRAVVIKNAGANDDGNDETDETDETDEDEAVLHQHTSSKSLLSHNTEDENEESDVELKCEDSDGEYAGATGSKQPISSNKKKYRVKKDVPDPNGRVKGRKLVMWHRPRMIEKLILHLQYECHRGGVKLPWDKVVERLSTGSSGTSALQHLNKMRDILITEGHMVPPLLGKASVPQDPTVRGYIRDMDAEKPTDTKVVRWGEMIEDRKTNLEVEGVVRGSGNYRRGLSKALEKTQKATGPKNKKTKKEVSASKVSSRAVSPDPAELASDEEYDPYAIKKKAKYGLRKNAKPISKYKVEDSDDEMEEEVEELAEGPIRPAFAVNTPQAQRLKGHDQGHGLVTPPSTSSKTVVLHIRPELLKRFDAGPGLKNELLEEEAGFNVVCSAGDMEQDFEDHSDDGTQDHDNSDAFGLYDSSQYQTPIHPLARDIYRDLGYQGMDIHGTRAQYDQAKKDGQNPQVNGLKYKQVAIAIQKGSIAAENRPTTVYSLAPPPAYPSGRVRKPANLLTGTSASAFSTFGSPNGKTATASTMKFHSYDETPDFVTRLSTQGISSTAYSGGEQMMSDTYYSNSVHYTSGSDLFQAGSTSFDASSLTAASYGNNYNRETSFETGLDGNGSFDEIAGVIATASSTPGFQDAVDNTATSFSDNLEDRDDTISRLSTPPHYLQYHEGEENKENQDWFGF